MFCFQCQEALKGTGCNVKAGYCGKTEDVAQLQDLVVYICKGIGYLGNIAEGKKKNLTEESNFVIDALFSTITNANFDRNKFIDLIRKGIFIREQLKIELVEIGALKGRLPDCAEWYANSIDQIEKKATEVGVMTTENEDVRSLRELLTYGIKGMAAYLHHAQNLRYSDPKFGKFLFKALSATIDDRMSVDDLTKLVLECGKYGVDAMAMLDKANTESYGHPEVTKVNLGVNDRPGILVSGHDLKDLEELLEQTRGSGVDVYTHSEMLPAHFYPAFKKYDNFIGNYGNAWWQQTEEFESFNGPILFTTNCLVPPKKSSSYSDRVYTTGATGFEGFPHIESSENSGQKDFSQIIDHAKKCEPPKEIEQGEITGGFAHNQMLGLKDEILEAVSSGAIRKFFVMAGCDGRMKSREYYTEFAEKLPKDTVILTAGCAKYRYNKLPLGDIGGIPRVLDAGQCNDSYSLAVVAMKLKEILGLEDINDLPIVYNIAWYEQKAVIVLLALLYLGVKNIHLGPTLPAFLSPNVANLLVENFGIGTIKDAESDIEMFMK